MWADLQRKHTNINKGRQRVRSYEVWRCTILVEVAVVVVNGGLQFHRVPCLRLAEPQQRGPMAAGTGGWRKYTKPRTAAAAAAAVCEPELSGETLP